MPCLFFFFWLQIFHYKFSWKSPPQFLAIRAKRPLHCSLTLPKNHHTFFFFSRPQKKTFFRRRKGKVYKGRAFFQKNPSLRPIYLVQYSRFLARTACILLLSSHTLLSPTASPLQPLLSPLSCNLPSTAPGLSLSQAGPQSLRGS